MDPAPLTLPYDFALKFFHGKQILITLRASSRHQVTIEGAKIDVKTGPAGHPAMKLVWNSLTNPPATLQVWMTSQNEIVVDQKVFERFEPVNNGPTFAVNLADLQPPSHMPRK